MRKITRRQNYFLLLGLAPFFISGCGYNQLQGLMSKSKLLGPKSEPISTPC